MGRLFGWTVLASALIAGFGELTAPLLLLVAADIAVAVLFLRSAGAAVA
jgi:hypothetical protein